MERSSSSVGKVRILNRFSGVLRPAVGPFIFSLVILGLIGAGVILTLHHPLEAGKDQIVRLEEGEGALALAKRIRPLRPHYIPLIFDQIVLSLMTRVRSLKVGEYDVRKSPSLWALVNAIHQGKSYARSITFIEGWTFRQWQEAMAKAPGIKFDSRAASSNSLALAIAPAYQSIEGWLMPETYFYHWGDSDLDIYQRAHELMRNELKAMMAATGDEVAARDIITRDNTTWFATEYDLLIMASIVEKESGQFSDQRRIARVFLNRLRENMRLQSDPTIIYALGRSFTGDLTRAHLTMSSPYNTYKQRGLPPTPIANPGRRAIAAVLSPAAGDWLYFVGRGDGSTEFSTTLRAHNRAVKKYQLGIE